jgi:hypothetical protein
MDWLPVPAINSCSSTSARQTAIFSKPMFCEYGQAHKRRQASIQGYGCSTWPGGMVILYAMIVCRCWRSLIALTACLQAVSARMRKQLIRPASRSRAYRSAVRLEQGLPTIKICWMNTVRVCLHVLSRTQEIFILKLRMLKVCL